MRRLILIRHAKTEPAGGVADFDRRLVARGRADALRLAEWFRKNRQSADLLAHSTAARAVETADAIANGWMLGKPRQPAPELYGAPWREILKYVRSLPDSAKTAVIVGHNPGIFDLANILTGSGEAALRGRLSEKMPTCGCAALDFSDRSWSQLESGGGKLSLYLTPDTF